MFVDGILICIHTLKTLVMVSPRHGSAVIRHADTGEIYIFTANQKHKQQNDDYNVDANDKPKNSSYLQVKALDDVAAKNETNQSGWYGRDACNDPAIEIKNMCLFALLFRTNIFVQSQAFLWLNT